MSWGLLIRNASGQVTFNSDQATGGGLFLDHVDVPASGGDVVVTYPAAQGRTLLASPVGTVSTFGGSESVNMSLPYCAIDYDLGYPRLTASPWGRAARVYVFADGAGSVGGSWGLEIRNPSSKLVVSENFSGMHYVGDAVYQGGRQYRISTNQDTAIIPFVVATSYSCIDTMYPIGGGQWDIFVKANGTINRVLVFQKLPNIGPAESWGLLIRRADGTVAFDTSRKPAFLRGLHDLSPYDNSYGISSLPVPSLTTPAVFCASSGVVREMTYGNFSDVYNESILAARVNGTILEYAYLSTYSFVKNHQYEPELLAPASLEDRISNGFAAVIDASIY